MSFPQTKPVRRAPPKLSRAAAGVFAKLTRKTRYAEPGLSENWPSIAGREVAALARPGRITGRGQAKTLEIVVRDGAAAAKMQMRADALIKAVNAYLGPGSVGHIAIRQSAAAPASDGSPAQADEIETASPLGSALSSFRAAVRARRSEK